MAYTTDKATSNRDMRRVVIREVNMEANFVTAEDAFGASFQISVDFLAPVVAIPVPGELWLVSKRGYDYYLERKLESGEEELSIEQLSPGDRRILTTGTIYLDGADVRINGQTIGEIVDPRFEELEEDLAALEANLPVLLDETTIVRTYSAQTVSGVKTFSNGMFVGAADVNLYKGGTSILKTDSNFHVAGNVALGWNGTAYIIQTAGNNAVVTGSVNVSQTIRIDNLGANGVALSMGGTGQLSIDYPSVTGGRLVLDNNGQLQLPRQGVTAGITMGGDVNAYRFAANVFMSDDVIGSFHGGRHTYIGSAYTTENEWRGGYFAGSLRWDGTNWINENAGGNNGWAMIATNGASGGLDIYTEPNTGASNRSYTPAQMVTKKVISITNTGVLGLGNVGLTIGDTAMSRTAANELEMASGDTFKVAAVGMKFNNGSVKTTAGSTVTTSLVGLTEYDGAQVWLKAGALRRMFIFDSTLARWVSDPWTSNAYENDISHNTTVSTNYTALFPIISDYSDWLAAGAHLQYRILWVWWNDSASTGELDFLLYGGNGGASYASTSIQPLASVGAGSSPATASAIWASQCDYGDNTWRDLGANFSGIDFLSGRFGIRSNAAPSNTITHVQSMHVIARLVSD
jgi:hypothetical protein